MIKSWSYLESKGFYVLPVSRNFATVTLLVDHSIFGELYEY